MYLLDLTLPTLAENLALDEALLLEAEAGGSEVLRLWEWRSPAVVLGAAGRLGDEVHGAACRADSVPIARRSSGGGTVLLGPGCLCFALVLAYTRHAALREIPTSYRYILGRLRDGFQRHRCAGSTQARSGALEPAGISDLALSDRKVCGNAQQRKRYHLLHHGTLLYDFDASLVGRYLPQPARRPEYRRQRLHADFMDNLPMTADECKSVLKEIWQADDELPAWHAEHVRRLVAEKYVTSEWLHRR